jgi:hypothetical protein
MSARALLLCVFAAAGCGDPVPEVEILEVTPTVVDPAADAGNDVRLRLRYADGDGDLGSGVAEVTDCRRAGLVTEVALPAIASDEAVAEGVSIDGELVVAVADVLAVESATGDGCTAFGAAAPGAGQASFCVVLVDTSDNRSEADCSDPIQLDAAQP